jgi:hypothetical protein
MPGQRSPWSSANDDWNRDPDIEEELDFTNADTLDESLRLMDFPGPALFRENETEVPDTSNYAFKWHEDARSTDISRAYLTAIDSNRDVAYKISKTEYILDSGVNRHFFNSTFNLHNFKPNMHQMYLSDNRSVPSIGTGDYGYLHDILVVPSLYVNLICISKLFNDYDFLNLFDKKWALILEQTLLRSTTLVAASLHGDNLYHTSDLSPLLHEKYRSRANTLKSTNGSSRAKYRTTTPGLKPLEVCPKIDCQEWWLRWSMLYLWPNQTSAIASLRCLYEGRMKAFPTNVLLRHWLIISSVNQTSSQLSRSSYVTIILRDAYLAYGLRLSCSRQELYRRPFREEHSFAHQCTI